MKEETNENMQKETNENKKVKKESKTKKKITKNGWIFLIFVVIFIIGLVSFISIQLIRMNIEDVNNQFPSGAICDKPIIYIYPEEEIELTVKLGKAENITCSYPKYTEDGWKVKAKPNGEIVDLKTGRNLYSLYWEGKDYETVDVSEGFCIKGEDTIKFLEEKLDVLGLNEREAEEFIVYWLPKMENNKYNYIRFATMEEINKIMPLEISKEPDSLIRILMQFKPLEKEIEIKEQKLETPQRDGYTVVEWGGTEIK